jgi:cyclopropane-fatty-acyl-phospholipid synthase
VSAHANSFVSKPAGPSAAWTDRWCLDRLARHLQGAPIEFRLWHGLTVQCAPGPSIGTVTIGDRRTLWRLLVRPALAFGEAYASGALIVDGDLSEMLEATNRALAGRPYEHAHRQRATSAHLARQNVHSHYDLGNDFYQLWLDEDLVYTCAYFEQPDTTLEQAQRAKLDLVCRKLALKPGQHVIEAGCGWGALALHMARHYDVTVTAYNISAPQLEIARQTAAREGLADRVTFVDGDYRSVVGQCDAFVSIGMLEHVGLRQYAALGRVIDRVLRPDTGRGLLHFIGRNHPMPFNPWITRYIFPGAYAPSLAEVLPAVLEPHRFAVLDVENLRLHYAETIRHWRDGFDRHRDVIRARFDDRFVRMWSLYLCSAQASFRSGDLQLFQVTFGRAADNSIPWTRRAFYGDRA